MPVPSTAERQEVRDTLLAHVSKHYCDAEIGGEGYVPTENNILVWQHDGRRDYLALWWASRWYEPDQKADGTTETLCSGGSATSRFYLAHLVRHNGRLQVAEQDMLQKQMQNSDVNSPYVVHLRFIESVRLNPDHTLNIISAKHAYGEEGDMEGSNFPSKQWHYRVRLPDMEVLEARYVGKTSYAKE